MLRSRSAWETKDIRPEPRGDMSGSDSPTNTAYAVVLPAPIARFLIVVQLHATHRVDPQPRKFALLVLRQFGECFNLELGD